MMQKTSLWTWVAIWVLAACGGGADSDGGTKKPKKETPDSEPRVEAVELAPREFELAVGESRQLLLSVRGQGDFDASVVWSSSDEEVATVVDGFVQAVAEGTATITATSVADPSKSDAATLTVVPAPPPDPGTLRIEIEGLPEGIDAEIAIRGPRDYVVGLPGGGVLEDLEPGTYTVTAVEKTDAVHRYLPEPAKVEVEIEAGATVVVEIAYRSLLLHPFEFMVGEVVLPVFGHADLDLTLRRAEGFEGEVEIVLERLPSGVRAEPVTLPGEEESATIRLESDGTIRELGAHELTIRGEAGELFASAPIEIRIEAVVTSLEDEGPGSLRSLVELADEFVAVDGGPLTITFDPSLEEGGEIELASPLEIDRELVIRGPEKEGFPIFTLQGNGATQLLRVGEGANLVIDSLNFAGGKAPLGGAIENEGSLRLLRSMLGTNEANVGGAIWNAGSLEIEETWLVLNEATMDGGAIFNAGTLHMHLVLFAQNHAEFTGGAIRSAGHGAHLEMTEATFTENTAGAGGAIYNTNATLLVLEGCMFQGNEATEGGAILTSSGFARVRGSTLSGNEAPGAAGGGIFVEDEADRVFDEEEFTLEVVGTIIEGNFAGGNGGGLLSEHARVRVLESSIAGNSTSGLGGGIEINGGSMLLERSTVSGNTAEDWGGGIMARGRMTVFNSTISENRARGGAGIEVTQSGELMLVQSTVSANVAESGRGGGITNAETISIARSIIAENTATEGPDIWTYEDAVIDSLGYNLIGDLEGSLLTPHETDITGENPDLLGLDDYGGPTLTMGIEVGSLPQDVIPVSACLDLDGEPLRIDQRGMARPAGELCDIGAYERQ